MVFLFIIKRDVKETDGIPVREGRETQLQLERYVPSALFCSEEETCSSSVEVGWPEV